MSTPSFEQALEVCRALPAPDRHKLREWLEAEAQREIRLAQQQAAAAQEIEDFRQVKNWLKANSAAYQGQWVALDGAQLISHGYDSKAVYDAAKAAGVAAPFMQRIATKEELPFGGW